MKARAVLGRTKLVLLGLGMCLIGVLSGCGGGDDDKTSLRSSTSAAAGGDESPEALIITARQMYSFAVAGKYADAYALRSARCNAKLSLDDYVKQSKEAFSKAPLPPLDQVAWSVVGGGHRAVVARAARGSEDVQKRYWVFENGGWRFDQCA